MREPKLSREIAEVTWFSLKLLLGFGVPLALLVLLARTHPRIAIGLMYGCMLAGFIVFTAYTNYKWKRNDWEWKKKDEERQREWDEVRERLRRQA